jgi:hypothetical protein
MFTKHPGEELNKLFINKPYQGANPSECSYLFIGLDANYAPGIEQTAIFPKIREYHEDAILFWQRYGVHHPFLLPEYTGDGQFYHRSFARIGFKPEHANLVSFIELLNIPTVGRNKLSAADFVDSHLQWLSSLMLEGTASHIFMPSGVLRLLKTTKKFSWLPSKPIKNIDGLGILYRDTKRTIYSHLHFSVYGKFQQQKIEEAGAIRKLLPEV